MTGDEKGGTDSMDLRNKQALFREEEVKHAPLQLSPCRVADLEYLREE